jgi:hypothetical protein
VIRRTHEQGFFHAINFTLLYTSGTMATNKTKTKRKTKRKSKRKTGPHVPLHSALSPPAPEPSVEALPVPQRKHGIKSEFVRTRPTMTVAEIIAAAAEQEIKLTKNHVYNIRSVDRKAALTKSDKSPAAKAQPAVTQTPAMANGKAPEVANGHKPAVANGKSAVTQSARASSRPMTQSTRAPSRLTSSHTRQARASSSSDAEIEMRTLVIRIGLDRAFEIFSEIEASAMSTTRGRKTPADSSQPSARQPS